MENKEEQDNTFLVIFLLLLALSSLINISGLTSLSGVGIDVLIKANYLFLLLALGVLAVWGMVKIVNWLRSHVIEIRVKNRQ